MLLWFIITADCKWSGVMIAQPGSFWGLDLEFGVWCVLFCSVLCWGLLGGGSSISHNIISVRSWEGKYASHFYAIKNDQQKWPTEERLSMPKASQEKRWCQGCQALTYCLAHPFHSTDCIIIIARRPLPRLLHKLSSADSFYLSDIPEPAKFWIQHLLLST